jgi:hypothetical protein
VTVVVPTGNLVPDAGTHVVPIVCPRSVADGLPNVTVLPAGSVASSKMSAGIVDSSMSGDAVSCTVTVNDACEALFLSSVLVQLTVEVPIGNVDALGGEHDTDRGPETASVALGTE